jgi:hypothetical protein
MKNSLVPKFLIRQMYYKTYYILYSCRITGFKFVCSKCWDKVYWLSQMESNQSDDDGAESMRHKTRMYVAVELLPHGLLPKSIRTTIKQNYEEDRNEFLGHLS